MALWQNRQARNPGRYLISPELGGAAYYATLTLADNPIEEGTLEVIESFLKASTSLLYGFSDPKDATPDDVFVAVYGLYTSNLGLITGLRGDLTDEIANRAAGDTTLQNNIDNLADTVENNKTDIANALADLDEAYKAADDTLQNNINTLTNTVASNKSAIESTVSALDTAYKAADATLQGNINALTNTVADNKSAIEASLQDEIDRATGVEADLLAQITNNYDDLDARVTTNATNITNNYNSLDARIKATNDALTSEANTRANADTLLQTNIDAEHVDMVNRSNTNASAIATETATRIANDNTLQANIDALEQKHDDDMTNAANNLAAERTRARNEESRIEQKFDDLNEDALALITAADNAIIAETARASERENQLDDLIKLREPGIELSTLDKYWRGDKTWTELMPDVRATTLIGLTLSDGTDIIANDTVLAALGKLQAHLTMTDAGLATEVEARTNADIIAFSIDPSTFIVTLTRGNGMLYESEIPYSSESQPGVITAQMYNQVINNAGSIDAMRNGLWVRGFLGQNPNQTTLTNIWLSIMGGTEVPVGARVTNEDENVPNGKDYFYTSTATGNSWVPKSVVAIPLFTNLYAGIIQGSLLDGEVSATSFGTGRVSGWDTLKTRVSTLESTKVNKTATIAISGPDVSAASVAIEDGAILQSVLSDTGIAAGDYGDTTRTIEDGGTFSILQVTVDSKGRLSSVLPHTMTLTHARNGILTGLVTTDASYVTQTDSILAAIGKHEARIIINAADITTKEPNIALGLEYQYWDGTKTWRSFNSSVRAALLTGLTIPVSAEIVATDNVLAAFGKTQAHLTALDTAVAGKEPSIALGTATQYWRGDKTWQVLENDVRATELIGFSLTALDDVVATDSVIGAFGKLQAQINRADADVSGKEPIIAAGTVTQYWRGDKGWHELNPAVIASVLTGYAATNAAIAATDTIVAAFGKAQGQINSKQPQLNGTGFVKASGTAISYDNSTYATTAALSTAIANAAALKFENLIVDMSAWSDDTEFPDYPFAANVPTANVTAAMYPEVVFNPADAANFAPVAASQAGSVRIFAAEQPTAAITILTIVLTR